MIHKVLSLKKCDVGKGLIWMHLFLERERENERERKRHDHMDPMIMAYHSTLAFCRDRRC